MRELSNTTAVCFCCVGFVVAGALQHPQQPPVHRRNPCEWPAVFSWAAFAWVLLCVGGMILCPLERALLFQVILAEKLVQGCVWAVVRMVASPERLPWRVTACALFCVSDLLLPPAGRVFLFRAVLVLMLIRARAPVPLLLISLPLASATPVGGDVVSPATILLAAMNVSSGLRNGWQLLQTFILSHHPDFLVVSETGLRQNDIDVNGEFWRHGISGYTAFHLIPKLDPDTGKTRKAISLWVRDVWVSQFEVSSPTPIDQCVAIHVKIKAGRTPLHVVALYGEPGSGRLKEQYWSRFRTWFEQEGLSANRTRVIVIGDCNVAPDPSVDRSSDGRFSRREADSRSFKALLTEGHLHDAWRHLHGSEKAFTWKGKGSDGVSNHSRIDLALTSARLLEKVVSCEIGEPVEPMMKDHLPIFVELQSPRNLRNLPGRDLSLPEIRIPRLRVKNLLKEDVTERYREAVVQGLRALPDAGDSLPEHYTRLTKMFYSCADKELGKYDHVFNAPPRLRVEKHFELLVSRCATVLTSLPPLLEEVESGLPMRSTHAIEKLLRALPGDKTLESPQGLRSAERVQEWFAAVERLHRDFLREASRQYHDERLEAILQNVARNADLETSRPRSWYGKVASLWSGSKSKKQQTIVTEEIDPTRVGTVHQSAESVKDAVMRFWADLFSPRETTSSVAADEPWFSESFAARRAHIPAMSKGLMSPITVAEIRDVLAHLLREKACGPDEIPGEILRALPDEAVIAMTEVFNGIMRTHRIPEEWRESVIYTLHKGNDPSKCSNFRPISLLCVPYKVFMSILTRRLTTLAEKGSLFMDVQGGFRKGRSCMDKIALLTGRLQENISAGRQSHVVFIDVKKAYDSIPHDRLFRALSKHGIDPEFLSLLRELYTGNFADVITPFGHTDPFPLLRGVKQGCPMSPVIFNLFLEPLLEWLVENGVPRETAQLAFADDIALFACDRQTLQRLVDLVDEYFYANKLELGIGSDKSVYMTSDASQDVVVSKVTPRRVDGKVYLDRVPRSVALPKLTGLATYRYLGVHVNVQLNWQAHLDKCTQKLRRQLFCLRRKRYTKRQLVKIVNTMLVPYLTYGLEFITVSAQQIADWQKMITKEVHYKGGVPWNATAHLNYLPVNEGGEGLVCLCDRIEQLQLSGLLKHGLNSSDSGAAEVTARRVQASERQLLNCVSTDLRWRQEVDDLVGIRMNSALNLPQLALERLLTDPTHCAWLRSFGVTNLSELIDGQTGRVRPQFAHDAILGSSLCVGNSLNVQPILLYCIAADPKVATTGLKHPAAPGTERTPLRVWTDGSKREDGRVGFSIWFGEGKPLNHIQRMEDGTEVFTAELHAAVSALLLHDPDRDFECFSDCEKIVQVLNDRKNELRKHPLEAGWLQAARSAQAFRDARGLKTTFTHVFSHLLDVEDGARRPERDVRKLAEMRKRFGNEARAIMEGNKLADSLAKESLDVFPRPAPLNMDMVQMPKFMAIDKETKRVLPAVPRFLQHKRQAEHRAFLATKGKYRWLSKGGVDWKQSAAIHKSTKLDDEALQKHAHRSKHGFFGTKDSRWTHRDDRFFQRVYRDAQVRDAFCDSCVTRVDAPVTETRTHYLECVANADIRKRTTELILERVNRDLFEPVQWIPCYWNADEKGRRHLDREWEAIERDFAPIDAAMGLVPKAWVNYLAALNRKGSCDLDTLITDCQRIALQGCYDSWRHRCRRFYACNPRPPPPPPDGEEVQPCTEAPPAPAGVV